MRVPVEIALQGGESDCRNRTLQQMFLMIHLGERAGSGLPKIRQGWEGAGGTLRLFDSFEPSEQTRLEMLWATDARPNEVKGSVQGLVKGSVKGSVKSSVKSSEIILALLRDDLLYRPKRLAKKLA